MDKPGFFVKAIIVGGKSVEIRRLGKSMIDPKYSVWVDGKLLGSGYRSTGDALMAAQVAVLP